MLGPSAELAVVEVFLAEWDGPAHVARLLGLPPAALLAPAAAAAELAQQEAVLSDVRGLVCLAATANPRCAGSGAALKAWSRVLDELVAYCREDGGLRHTAALLETRLGPCFRPYRRSGSPRLHQTGVLPQQPLESLSRPDSPLSEGAVDPASSQPPVLVLRRFPASVLRRRAFQALPLSGSGGLSGPFPSAASCPQV